MNATELEAALANFMGTEQYHNIVSTPFVLATDGVAFLAKEAQCYWLTDLIASYQPSIRSNPKISELWDFQVWKLTKNKTGSGAKVVCTDGNEHAVFSQRIPYTDFPLQEITIWVGPQEVNLGVNMVMYLPSEH